SGGAQRQTSSAFGKKTASRSEGSKSTPKENAPTAIPRSIHPFTWPTKSPETSARNQWKTPYNFRKKNTARFQRCSKRRPRLPTRSSTWREARPTAPGTNSTTCAPRLSLYRRRGVVLGSFGNARTRGVYRASASRRSVSRGHQSSDPFTKPRDAFAGGAVADSFDAPRMDCPESAATRLSDARSPGRSGRRGVELSLLRRDSADERCDRDHSAIHGAGVGTAVYDRARSAASIRSQDRGGCVGGCGLHAGRGPRRLGRLSHGPAGGERGSAGGLFVRLLQHWRTQRARALRSVESFAVGTGWNGRVLDGGESSLESFGRALWAP